MTASRVTRHARAAWCVLLVATLAGCDTSASPSPATAAPGSTSAAGTAPAGTPGPVATQAGDVRLPPGAQFARAPTSIPGEAEPVVTQFLTRAYFFATRNGKPEALFRDGTEWQRAVIDDGAGYHPPAGSSLDGSFRVVAAAANDHAMVVIGSSTTTDHDRPAGFDRLPESVIWATRDGKAFQRIDVRDVVDAAAIRLTAVAATSGGFVAIGDVLPNGFKDPGGVVVLRSDDGERWTAGERLNGQGTLHARALFAERDTLVIDATDQWCDARGITFPGGLRDGITVSWGSSDGGGSWHAVDLGAAAPVISQSAALIEGCAPNVTLGDLIAQSQQLDTDGAIVGLAGGALVARSGDGAALGVSADLATWTQVSLPGALPMAGAARRPHAQAIIVEATGAIRTDTKLALLALEDRADLDGRPKSGGCQVRWWRSPDGGATWSTGPLGRPFSSCAGATWTFDQLLDGSVVLFANAITANTNRGEASFRTGTPGELIAWDTCAPGPNVDCSFATLGSPTSGALDWAGINLSGATVTSAVLDGVQMPKANAYAALLSGSFQHANLSEAILSYAILEGTFAGADLHDANLFNAMIRADLTGANLAGTELSGVTFGEGALCADGKAPAAGTSDAKVACRL